MWREDSNLKASWGYNVSSYQIYNILLKQEIIYEAEICNIGGCVLIWDGYKIEKVRFCVLWEKSGAQPPIKRGRSGVLINSFQIRFSTIEWANIYVILDTHLI